MKQTLPTFVSNDLSRQFLTTAGITEDLPTNTTVMSPAERRESVAALVTLATTAVRHPVLLEVTVPVELWRLQQDSHGYLQYISQAV